MITHLDKIFLVKESILKSTHKVRAKFTGICWLPCSALVLQSSYKSELTRFLGEFLYRIVPFLQEKWNLEPVELCQSKGHRNIWHFAPQQLYRGFALQKQHQAVRLGTDITLLQI